MCSPLLVPPLGICFSIFAHLSPRVVQGIWRRKRTLHWRLRRFSLSVLFFPWHTGHPKPCALDLYDAFRSLVSLNAMFTVVSLRDCVGDNLGTHDLSPFTCVTWLKVPLTATAAVLVLEVQNLPHVEMSIPNLWLYSLARSSVLILAAWDTLFIRGLWCPHVMDNFVQMMLPVVKYFREQRRQLSYTSRHHQLAVPWLVHVYTMDKCPA